MMSAFIMVNLSHKECSSQHWSSGHAGKLSELGVHILYSAPASFLSRVCFPPGGPVPNSLAMTKVQRACKSPDASCLLGLTGTTSLLGQPIGETQASIPHTLLSVKPLFLLWRQSLPLSTGTPSALPLTHFHLFLFLSLFYLVSSSSSESLSFQGLSGWPIKSE